VGGRKLLRDWGSDTSKIFLDFSWVQRSLDAKKPLLQADQFGHCRLFDDGRPISDEHDEGLYTPTSYNFPSSVAQLPTPRPTPTTSSSSANASTPQHSSPPSQPLPATNPVPFNNNMISPIQSQLVPSQSWPQLPSSTNPFLPSSGMVVPFSQQFPLPNSQMLSLLSDPNYMAMFEFFCRQQMQQQQFQGQLQYSYQQPPCLPQPQPSPLPPQPLQTALSGTDLSVDVNASISSASIGQTQPSQHHIQKSSNVQAPLSGTSLTDHLNHTHSSSSNPAPPRTRDNSSTFVDQEPEEWSKTSKVGPPLDRDEPAIFEEDLGVPLKFLVQIQIKNRNQITKSIKVFPSFFITTYFLSEISAETWWQNHIIYL
jgi:hypothetical protein